MLFLTDPYGNDGAVVQICNCRDLPEAVNRFLETRNIELIYRLQRNLIAGYEEKMLKYADFLFMSIALIVPARVLL